MASRKQAPRREVVNVERRGEWGEVRYVHRLSCGHQEVRKRVAPASHIACMMCLRDAERPVMAEWRMDEVDPYASTEADVASIRASLAARLGVSNEAVNVVVDGFGRVSYASVFIDGETLRRLI